MELTRLNLNDVLEQVGREKNIDPAVLIEALEAAMVSAARKKLGLQSDLEARYNAEIGEVEVFEFRRIVKAVENKATEISLADALKLDPALTEDAIGEDLGIKLSSEEFGRIAAQNAKQIIVQRVRDAERSMVYAEYKSRQGETVTGTVRRFERRNIVVDLGRVEAVIPEQEQVSKENIRPGDRIVAYVVDVLEVSRGPQIILSRTHPNLVVKLFEHEVPEMSEGGIVVIEGVAREAGFRTKIAVSSKDQDVDPVGACVGMKGSRVQAVVQELKGEKIDIVPYDKDEARFVCSALAPADISRVLVNEGEHAMRVVVPDDQLSLAIGKRGQNVRLAAQLTGWKIDICSESKLNQEREQAFASLSQMEALSEIQIQTLYNHGIRSIQMLINTAPQLLKTLPGFADVAIEEIISQAQGAGQSNENEKATVHDQARLQAGLLLSLNELLQKHSEELSLNALAVPSKIKALLLENFYNDMVDVYLESNPERLAKAISAPLSVAHWLKTEIAEQLSRLAGKQIVLKNTALSAQENEEVKSFFEQNGNDDVVTDNTEV